MEEWLALSPYLPAGWFSPRQVGVPAGKKAREWRKDLRARLIALSKAGYLDGRRDHCGYYFRRKDQ
jgi:hypothetical protein